MMNHSLFFFSLKNIIIEVTRHQHGFSRPKVNQTNNKQPTGGGWRRWFHYYNKKLPTIIFIIPGIIIERERDDSNTEESVCILKNIVFCTCSPRFEFLSFVGCLVVCVYLFIHTALRI